MNKLDLGAVTAYAMAVEKGYEGSEEEFAALQAESGNNAVRAEVAASRAQQILDSIPMDFQEVSRGVATLTQEMAGKVMAGVGKFSTDDWLPLVVDLNEATPNRIVAIPKGDYSTNVPGVGAESQGTLIPFAYRNSADVECQVQLFVTLSEKLYFRNKWGRDDAWNPWVLVATSEEVTNAVKNSVSGIGQFVTSDSLPLIEDANDVTPNTILAIAKANYVQNMPGRQGDSQGTLMHFAFANRADANCQVQMLVTPERKVWIRNLWSTDDGWRSWVQLETKVTFYIGGGDKATHTRLLDAINDANALPDHIHVDIMVCQNVNLYEELGGADYVASFTDATNPNAGPTLRTNVDLIGVGMPTISLVCPDDVATYNFTYSVSPLNLKGTNKLSGIVFVGKNTRYVIHDEGGGSGDYNRIVENCYFYHNGTFNGGWYSGQAYGAGTGHSGAYLFDGCVFESPKMPFSIHNNHNVVRPIVKFVNCVFKGGAGYPGARFGTYGSGYVQGNVYLNGCRSSGVIRTVTEGNYDTFNDAGFQIIPGDTVYRTDLAKLTYYVGHDVWKEI